MKSTIVGDEALWLLIKQHNEAAFNELYKRHWLHLYDVALSLTNDTEKSKEIVHDVFFNVWKKKEGLDIKNIKHYLIALAKYEVFRQAKLKKREIELTKELKNQVPVIENNYALEKFKTTELSNKILEYINLLPKRCREIFVLSRHHEMSNAHIADKFSISKRTVENQITVALQFLRANLNITTVISYCLLLQDWL